MPTAPNNEAAVFFFGLIVRLNGSLIAVGRNCLPPDRRTHPLPTSLAVRGWDVDRIALRRAGCVGHKDQLTGEDAQSRLHRLLPASDLRIDFHPPSAVAITDLNAFLVCGCSLNVKCSNSGERI